MGCVSAIDSNAQTIWIADTQRGDGKRCLKKERERHPQSVRALLYENGTILTRRQPRSDSLIAKQANGQASKSRAFGRKNDRRYSGRCAVTEKTSAIYLASCLLLFAGCTIKIEPLHTAKPVVQKTRSQHHHARRTSVTPATHTSPTPSPKPPPTRTGWSNAFNSSRLVRKSGVFSVYMH